MRLSVLDQSPIAHGSTGADALRNSIDLAQHNERLGFHRTWVAEHHGGPSLAGTSPEILIGALAAATQTMRIGSGGVMLPHYSPLKVAEVFSVLSGLHPGRIDLGLGRASGTDPITTFALQRDRRQAAADDFPQQLAELLAWLEDDLPADHPFRNVHALPVAERPDVWMLGSSRQSALWAAELGLPYAFADFINPGGSAFAKEYRERFAPSVRRERPETAVAVWVIVADTEEEAQRLAASSRMSFTLLRQGRLIPVPPVDEAIRWLEARGRTVDDGGSAKRRGVVGAPAQVRAKLEELADAYGAEEVIAVTITYDHEARKRSYALLAEAFGLEPTRESPDVEVASRA